MHIEWDVRFDPVGSPSLLEDEQRRLLEAIPDARLRHIYESTLRNTDRSEQRGAGFTFSSGHDPRPLPGGTWPLPYEEYRLLRKLFPDAAVTAVARAVDEASSTRRHPVDVLSAIGNRERSHMYTAECDCPGNPPWEARLRVFPAMLGQPRLIAPWLRATIEVACGREVCGIRRQLVSSEVEFGRLLDLSGGRVRPRLNPDEESGVWLLSLPQHVTDEVLEQTAAGTSPLPALGPLILHLAGAALPSALV